jgi:amino acid permease
MLASAIGTGCLNLPLRVHQLGILPYIIVVFLTGTFSYYGMQLMKLIIVKFQVHSYPEMIRRAFGDKIMRYSEIVIIFYTWAVSICFEVIFMKFSVQLLNDVIGLPLYDDREQ